MSRSYNTSSSEDVANILYTYLAEVNAVDGGSGPLQSPKFIRHQGKIVKMILPGPEDIIEQARSTK